MRCLKQTSTGLRIFSVEECSALHMEGSATEEPELSAGASGCALTNGTEGRYKACEILLAEKNCFQGSSRRFYLDDCVKKGLKTAWD